MHTKHLHLALGHCPPELSSLSALHIAANRDEWMLGPHQVVLWGGEKREEVECEVSGKRRRERQV